MSAIALADEALADIFTRAYAGYWFPVEVDADRLRRMVSTYDIDRSHSVAVLDGHSAVGVALLAVRGNQGWVGGMGVLESHRGAGIGERLMRRLVDRARAAGVRRLRLEVLVQNTPAVDIYRRLGFADLEDVALWKLEEAPRANREATAASVDEALDALAAAVEDAPWQLDVASLRNMRALGSELRAAQAIGGTAVYTMAGAAATILALVADSREAASALLAAPFAAGAERLLWINGPVTGPAADALRSAGATELGRQHHLALLL